MTYTNIKWKPVKDEYNISEWETRKILKLGSKGEFERQRYKQAIRNAEMNVTIDAKLPKNPIG